MIYFKNLFLKLFLFLLLILNNPIFSMKPESKSYFVGNMPAYVPSETETETTDSESIKKYIFTDQDFEDPPYATTWTDNTSRGKLVPGFIYKDDNKIVGTSSNFTAFVTRANELIKLSSKSYSSKVVEPYLCLLKASAFLSEKERDEKLQNIKFVIGLNRPRSLSSKKNRVLYKELVSLNDSSIDVELLGFFWDFPWVKFNRDKKDKLIINKKGKNVSYDEVLSFYRQLKKRNPEKAKEFRIANEKRHGIRNRMVPYRSLREFIKNHSYTKRTVNKIIENDLDSSIYLFITDSDTMNLNGLFSSYFKIAENEKPDVITTGYLFSSKEPLIQAASLLDMIVRRVTAENIPMGVYFPEPSLCLLILPKKETIEDSFEELTLKNKKKSNKDYCMPGESKKILKRIIESREDSKILFAKGRKPLIQAPARVLKNKKGGILSFSAIYNSEKRKFENWEFSDLINITKNSAQSHAYSKSWATNLMDALELNDIRYANKNLNKKHTRDLVISLLSRLFNSYNPIYLAKENKKTLFKIINNYDSFVSNDEIDKYESQKKRSYNILTFTDKINSREELLKILSLAIKNHDVELIRQAAENSGREIAGFLNKYFDFSDKSSLEEQFGGMKITKN